jgi:hypothetical protein
MPPPFTFPLLQAVLAAGVTCDVCVPTVLVPEFRLIRDLGVLGADTGGH